MTDAPAATAHPPDLATLPRVSASAAHGPRRAHPMAACFDDLSASAVHDFYRKNFRLFGFYRKNFRLFGHNPANGDGAPMA
jgi:hypothetical protein